MSFLKSLLIFLCLLASPALAQSDPETLRPLINELAKGKYAETEQQIGNLAATGDPAVAPALEALGALDARALEIVELRFVCGFSFVEIAELLEVSERTVSREWQSAKVWLYAYLSKPV